MSLPATHRPYDESSRFPGWRVHLCTTTASQQEDDSIVRDFLQEHGCTLLSRPDDALELKLTAARDCDLCLLLLGSEFAERDPRFSFSHTEWEVSAAADVHPDKVIVFARQDDDSASSAEQREFAQRMQSFQQGAFRRMYQTADDLRSALDEALGSWTPPQPLTSVQPRAVPSTAVMISSTGDLGIQRANVRAALTELGFPVIDYLYEPSETVTPVDRVVSWARHCHALVLILDARYGYISPLDGLGVTELEFVTALEAHRPILAFIGPQAETTKDEDQRQFVERVRWFVPEDHIFTFTTPDDTAFQQHLRSYLAPPGEMSAPTREAPPRVPDTVRLRWYKRQAQRWLGVLPHPLQAAGMPLEQIYLSLGLSPVPLNSDTQHGSDEREKATLFEAESAIAQFPRLVLQGDPGMGKSVALRWLAISAQDDVVPMYIRLGLYARAYERGAVTSLEEYIRQEERRLGLSATDESSLWMTLLCSGRGVVLLDGLDEVSAHASDPSATHGASGETPRDAVVRAILTLSAQLPPTTPIVVATRVLDGSAERLASAFSVLHVQPMTPTQQRQLILQWLYTAHPGDALQAVRTVQRTLDLLQTQAHLQTWATTPLMLTLLTALVDSMDDVSPIDTFSKAVVLRRALRLLLGQWGTIAARADSDQLGKRRLGGRHLWAKEQLLLGLGWRTFQGGQRQLATIEDVQAVWETLPQIARDMGTASELLAELSGEEGFLPQVGEGEYVFYHPTFQEYLSAVEIAAMEADERGELMACKRLDAGWDEASQLLVAELDRIGRHVDADAVIQTLVDADSRSLAALGGPDPTHLALRRAARAQGDRTADRARGDAAAQLASAWGNLLQDSQGTGYRAQRQQALACQAFLDMGSAAVYAAPLLRSVASRPPAWLAGRSPAAIEALGNCGAPEDVEFLAGLLQRDEGIDEPQAAALRALLRLGVDVVRPYRDLLPRFVYAHSAMRWDITKAAGEAAAAILIHLEPTPDEMRAIAELGERWRQEAFWVAPQLPVDEAIQMLRKGLNESSVFFASLANERSRFDFRGDTNIDDRFAALAACSRMEATITPLLELLIFRTIYDVPRNRRLAESVVVSLGAAAVPAMQAYIETNCPNEMAQQRYFGAKLPGLRTATDEQEICHLLSQSIAALSEFAHKVDERFEPLRVEERKKRAAQVAEQAQAVSVENWSTALHSAQSQADASARDYIIVSALDALEALGPAAAGALDELVTLAQDANYRRRAIAVLAGLGIAGTPALPNLHDALNDSDPRVRALAAKAVGQLEPSSEVPLSTLHTLLVGKTLVREQLRAPAAGTTGEAAEDAQLEAIKSIERLWPQSRELLPDLVDTLRVNPSREVRRAVIQFLGRVADPTEDLLHALSQASQEVAPREVWAIDISREAQEALELILMRTVDVESLDSNLRNVAPAVASLIADEPRSPNLMMHVAEHSTESRVQRKELPLPKQASGASRGGLRSVIGAKFGRHKPRPNGS